MSPMLLQLYIANVKKEGKRKSPVNDYTSRDFCHVKREGKIMKPRRLASPPPGRGDIRRNMAWVHNEITVSLLLGGGVSLYVGLPTCALIWVLY